MTQLALSGLSYQFLWPSLPWWGGVNCSLFLTMGTALPGFLRLNFYSSRQSFSQIDHAHLYRRRD